MECTVLAKVETIGEADMRCLVETNDVTYLVKDESLAKVLIEALGRCVTYVPPNSASMMGIHVIADWQSKSYVLIGHFSDNEIKYIESRCRSR